VVLARSTLMIGADVAAHTLIHRDFYPNSVLWHRRDAR